VADCFIILRLGIFHEVAPFLVSSDPSNLIVDFVRSHLSYSRFSWNLSKRFSHRGFPSRVPIDRGRVTAPVVGSFHTSRRTASKVGQRSRSCVLVIVGGCMLSYLSSQNQHPAWARLPIRIRYAPVKPYKNDIRF
jgi:hypothetical protein